MHASCAFLLLLLTSELMAAKITKSGKRKAKKCTGPKPHIDGGCSLRCNRLSGKWYQNRCFPSVAAAIPPKAVTCLIDYSAEPDCTWDECTVCLNEPICSADEVVSTACSCLVGSFRQVCAKDGQVCTNFGYCLEVCSVDVVLTEPCSCLGGGSSQACIEGMGCTKDGSCLSVCTPGQINSENCLCKSPLSESGIVCAENQGCARDGTCLFELDVDDAYDYVADAFEHTARYQRKYGKGWLDKAGGVTNLRVIRPSKYLSLCEDECTKNPECVAYTYIASISQCDLKEETGIGGGFVERYDLIAGLKTADKGVSCGGHSAKDCSKCVPLGKGANYCNGDCTWINDTCILASKEPTKQLPGWNPHLEPPKNNIESTQSTNDEGDSGDCVEEGVYLAWHNGEPIEQETKAGEDAAWCRRKCAANRKCAGWTLNTKNGWCALKGEGQIKRQTNAGFVSGVNC